MEEQQAYELLKVSILLLLLLLSTIDAVELFENFLEARVLSPRKGLELGGSRECPQVDLCFFFVILFPFK